MITDSPVVAAETFERATGWQLKPEGACRGDVCIPLPQPRSGAIDLRDVAARLDMPLVEDPESGLWALGPPAGPTLDGPLAPDFTLPDRGGGEFTLSSLRGVKVLILAWAPW